MEGGQTSSPLTGDRWSHEPRYEGRSIPSIMKVIGITNLISIVFYIPTQNENLIIPMEARMST
jgi:hypothetical protein